MCRSIVVSMMSEDWWSIKQSKKKDLKVPCTFTQSGNFVFVYIPDWECFEGVLWVGKTEKGKAPVFNLVAIRIEMWDIPKDLGFTPMKYINLETRKNVPLHNFLHKRLSEAGGWDEGIIIQDEVERP